MRAIGIYVNWDCLQEVVPRILVLECRVRCLGIVTACCARRVERNESEVCGFFEFRWRELGDVARHEAQWTVAALPTAQLIAEDSRTHLGERLCGSVAKGEGLERGTGGARGNAALATVERQAHVNKDLHWVAWNCTRSKRHHFRSIISVYTPQSHACYCGLLVSCLSVRLFYNF